MDEVLPRRKRLLYRLGPDYHGDCDGALLAGVGNTTATTSNWWESGDYEAGTTKHKLVSLRSPCDNKEYFYFYGIYAEKNGKLEYDYIVLRNKCTVCDPNVTFIWHF